MIKQNSSSFGRQATNDPPDRSDAKIDIPQNALPSQSDANTGLEFCIRSARAYLTVMSRMDKVLSGLHGLGFADFMILYHLERAPGAKLRRVDLAERMGMTASGVTRTLLPLEKLGLVERQADPRDARVGYAALTEQGRQLLGCAITSARQVVQVSTEPVPQDQMETMSSLLGRLAGMNLANS